MSMAEGRMKEAAGHAWARLDGNADGQLDLDELAVVVKKCWSKKKGNLFGDFQ